MSSSACQWCLALEGQTISTGHSDSYATDTPIADLVLPRRKKGEGMKEGGERGNFFIKIYIKDNIKIMIKLKKSGKIDE